VKILAKVNGVPITEHDVAQRSKRGAAGAPGHDVSGNVLQTVVRDELIFQKAVELGLDTEPEYRQRLDALEAQLRAFQRQEMSTRYRRYVQENAAVTDAEARAYFDERAPFIRTRFHVLQILYRGRHAEIVKDHQDVKSGMSFEDVASRRFPGFPKESRPPWDLGEMYWHQIPQSWRGIVDRLEPGEVSEVIRGDNERFWVIKLANKATDPRISFETEKDRIVEVLRQQKADALYDSMLADLKGKADIVYSK
jgi:hypothetical protein